MSAAEPRPISRFPIGDVTALPSPLREQVAEIAERTGFLPNLFAALAARPAELAAFLAYHQAVMEREGGLSKVEREMIVVATSAARSCPYCVVVHGAILRLRSKDPELSDWLAVNYRQAPVSAAQRALLDYAVRLSQEPECVGEADLQALREAGYDDDAIWDASAVVALFALSNRLAHALALVPNDEFFTLGRGVSAPQG